MNGQYLSLDALRLTRAIRFVCAVLTLGLCYFVICLYLFVPTIRHVYQEMFHGKPMPVPTEFVVNACSTLVLINVLASLFLFATLFSRYILTSFYLLGVFLLMVIAQMILLVIALLLPFVTVVTSIQGR